MSAPPPVTFTVEADGVGWIVFDAPGARANVLNEPALAAFAAALDALDRSAARAAVVCSAKEKIFIAGADLRQLAALPDVATATELARRGQRLFQRVAELRVPVVCAIHGACAGGGFELALACHGRIASAAAATQIGLPETSIGVIPGWGGCVRLPRLIGAQVALEHILAGQLIAAAEAAKAGLIDEVVPVAELKTRAAAVALKLAAERASTRASRTEVPANFFAEVRAKTAARTRGHLPAPLAAIGVVERTAHLPVRDALEIEARAFGEVAAGQVCKNLIRVFFLRDAAKKCTLEGWFAHGPEQKPVLPQRIAVVGAGVMGSGIAHWLAVRGFAVVLREVSPELVGRGLEVVRRLFDETVQRGRLSAGEADIARQRIATTTTWDGFADCDFVIEAIVENVAAKRRLFSEVAGIVRPDAVLASNTSALPIEEIAGHVPNPGRAVGIHFFNPVSRMPLVELIVGRATSADTAARALALVQALGKAPILCRSSPGFLVTRVLFIYLNEAVRLWEQGVATAAIDDAMRDWGWPMGPLRLIDEVGIDVTDFIFGELAHAFPARFARATATGRLLAAGMKGRKNGAGTGFYSYAPRETLNDAIARPAAEARGELALSAPQIAERLMRVMVDEARRCLDEGVVKSADDVDFALLSGAGFPAWRGGLMAWAGVGRSAGG